MPTRFAGFGQGDLTLTQAPHARRAEPREYKTDIGMMMTAVGARGEVVSPATSGGLSVAIKSDAFWVNTESDAVTKPSGYLGATEGDASRIRLLTEVSRSFDTGDGSFTPSIEVGLRHDGGDAETGAGLEVAGSVRHEGQGFSVEGSVRTLIAHEQSGYEEWGASGALRIDPGQSGRELSLSLAPSWGAASTTGQVWTAPNAKGLTPQHAFDAGPSLDVEVGYGFGLANTPGVFTPFAALSLAGEYRTMRAGARWGLGYDASLGLEGARTTADAGEDGVALMLRGEVRW